MRARGDGGGAARTRAALAAVVAALAFPSSAYADQWVGLFEWGVSPPVLQVEAGETVHFSNWSGLPTAVASENSLFDSGVLAPGGGYSVRMTVPGTHFYATEGLSERARIDVFLTKLDGDPTAPAEDNIPDLAFPEPKPDDEAFDGVLGGTASRSRLLVALSPEATVAEANEALDDASVRIIGGLPDFGVLLVEVPLFFEFAAAVPTAAGLSGDDWKEDPGGGDALGPVRAAADELLDHDAVETAAVVPALEANVVPGPAEPAIAAFPGANWAWDPPVDPSGGSAPLGSGGNNGLESARFPQAWNLLEEIRRRGNAVTTGVVDGGFEANADLSAMTIRSGAAGLCRTRPDGSQQCTANTPGDHGTHVAGTIGADWANPSVGNFTLGVSGANPVAKIEGVPWDFGAGGGFDSTMEVFHALFDAAEAGTIPNLRVVNFSVGRGFPYTDYPQGRSPDWWNAARKNPTCGPGDSDDDTGGLWCTPNNDDGSIASWRGVGQLARRVAERASALGILIVQAAGNESDTFCIPPGQVGLPDGQVPAGWQPCAATSPAELVRTQETAPFAWASANWTSAVPNPVVVVEAVSDQARASFSNIGGDLSAPGVDILSTTISDNGSYEVMSGTSMAAPHVAALAGYMLAFEPSLTVAQVRQRLLTNARADTTAGAQPRLDAFSTMLTLPGAAKALVDVNDASKDGNHRVDLLPDGELGPLDTVFSTEPGYRTQPDGVIDMRDFRRFRDAMVLVTSLDNAPQVNGGADHPKRDLNFDGCVNVARDQPDCATREETYPRFDFNGNGALGFAPAPVPLNADGSPAPGAATPMSDLQVLQTQWDPDPARTEGWTADDLTTLLEDGSADLEIRADAFFAAGANNVTIEARSSGRTLPTRALARNDDFLVMTVPLGGVELTATADSDETLTSSMTVPPLLDGNDRRVDLCLLDLDLSASKTTVLVGGTAQVFATLAGCEGDDVSGREIAFSLLPVDPAGATLSPETAETDADGRAQSSFDAGDIVGPYTVTASVDLGDGRRLEDELQIEVVPALKVAYAWRQEILEWSEDGSSRWGPPLDPLMPDCVAAGVPYCIDTFTLGAAAPFNALEREGVIAGLGNALTLTEEVAASPNSSRQSWTVTDADGTRSDEQVVQWQVAPDQLNRYTDFALPNTVRTREDEDGIRLFGLRAVAGLGYLHDASIVDPSAAPAPIELWFTTGRMLLQPRGDGSSLQYAPKTTVPILFPRKPDGTFAPYTYCQTIEYDLTSERGYWNPSSSEWVRGATDQGRKTTYTAGDRPMPVGPGRLRVRYSFGAVAAYGADDPGVVAPACEETNPPDASFIYGPEAVDEGRMVAFTSTSTDPENDIVSWEWNFGDGTVESGIPNTFGLTGHLFKNNGVYEVSLKVTDSEGNSDTTSKTILVANLPPEANIEDATGVEGGAIDVPFSVWDPSETDSRALQVQITLAGQATPLLSTTRASGFSTFRVGGLGAGAHTLTLRVEDPDGAVATDTATVTVLAAGVEPPPPPPPPDPTPTCVPDVVLDAEEQAFLNLLNLYRAQSGLAPVGASPTLTPAAERHVNDMATNDNFSHTGTDGSTPFKRAKDAAYPGETVSENLFFGSPRAQDALVSWKSSTTGHNENMLQPQWRAIGIARQFGSGKWFWATSFGDLLDCPGVESTAAAASTTTARKPATEGTAESVPVRSLFAAAAAKPSAAAAVLLPYDPLAAFTISNVQPRENAPITVVNRSRDAAGTPIAAVLAYGDGLLLVLGPDESAVIRLPPFNQDLELTATDATGRESDVVRSIWVDPLPAPSVQYTGDTFGASGKPMPVSARVRSPYDNSLLAGVQVTFTVSGATVTATTDALGVAATNLVLTGVAAGSHQLRIDTAPTEDFAASTRTSFVEVIANAAPVANAGGPYVIGDGGTLLLDAGLSTDPTPGDTFSLEHAWDLDADGAFDDAVGTTPAELTWDRIRLLVCGGACALSTAYPIAVRATDRWGDSGDASTTLTITGDFGIVLGAGTITVVPGATNSIAVDVVGSVNWTEPVTLSVAGLPAGVTATFGTNPVTPTGTSVLTLTAGASVENGTFPVRVIGTGGGLTRETGEDVTVAFGLIPICFGSYSGTVTDSETGAPVAGVAIRLFNASGFAQTDENGRYVLRNAALGNNNAPRTHSVRTEHNDYWEGSVSAQAVCRGVTRVDFAVVRKQTGRLTGTVVDRETRLPINGARLSSAGAPTAFTDAGGAYGLDLPLSPNNQPRFYTYRAEATGYWPQNLSTTADRAVPQVLDFGLLRKCQGTIRGGTVRVRQTGAVVPSVVVRLTLTNGGTVSTTTNVEGRYSFDRLVDLGDGNSPIGYFVQAFLPPGSPPGSTHGSATFLLETCGGEAFTDIELGIPVENVGVLEGVVRDEETLDPVAGVNVRACSGTCLDAITNAEGFYRFPRLHLGYDSQVARSFTMAGIRDGYYSAALSSPTVRANETTTFDFTMLRQRFGRLEGTVTDILSGAPIPGAAVQDFFGCAFNSICAISNREGLYLDAAVPLGSRNAPVGRSFQFTATGYWPVSRAATFTADTTTVVNVQLLKECPAARVVGTVVNAETQAPILGANVSGGGQFASTDAAGRFTLTGLRAGSGNSPVGVSVTASATGFFSQTKSITIYCGAVIVVDFGSRESGLGTIVGTVTSADSSAPLEDVLVASEFGGAEYTDAAGNYRFEQVPLGDLNTDRAWKVTAFPEGFKPQTKTVIARANVDVRADFSFSALGNAKPVADGLTVRHDEDRDAIFRLTGSDADDDPLTFHVMRYPAHGQVFGTAPDLFFRPDRDFNGTDTLEFVVNDGLDNSERATVTFTVRPTNDPPAAFQDNLETGVDVPLEIPFAQLLVNDVDIDGDALTVTNVQAFSGSQAELREGTVLFTPPPGFESDVPTPFFVYTASDGSGATSSAWVYLRVTRQALAPVCADAAFETDVGVPLDATVACTDGNGDALTYQLVTGPSSGFLVLDPDGSFTFTPTPGFTGMTSFVFRATDGKLPSANATATIVVAPENGPPVAGDVEVATDEDTPVAIVLAATDPDGDTLTFTHGDPSHGTFDGTTYTPAPNFHGTDSFTYTADDGLATDDGTVTITVRPVNDAPVAVADSVTTPEDTAVTGNVLANDTDVDGDALTATLEQGPLHGDVTLAPNGGFTYTPDPNYAGPDEFSYRASDGALGAVASVQIQVTPVEDEPTAADDAFSTDEDTAVSGTVLANDGDPEGGALTTATLDAPGHGTLALAANGLFTYTPAANFQGSDSFTYTATDPAGRTATATARIEVRAVNDPPTAQDVSESTDEDVPLDLVVGGADVDGDPLAVEWTQPGHGSYDGVRYVPAADFNGADGFTYTVRDPSGLSATATVTIEVRPVNDAPVAGEATVETDEDVPVAIALGGSDVDADTLTFRVDSGPAHGTYAGGVYTPAANYHGPEQIAFTADDGQGGTDTGTVAITVRPVNDAPVAEDKTVTTLEDTPLAIALGGSDVDGDPLTFRVETGPAHGTYADGTYTPASNYDGPDSFTYVADDGKGGTDSATVQITVEPAADAPTATDKTVATDEDTPVAIALGGTDPDGDDLVATLASPPAHGTYANGTYTPAANYHGPDSFTFTVSDGDESDTGTVSITVRPVNDAPVARDLSVTTAEDTPVAVALSASDVDGDTVTFTWGQPAHGAFDGTRYVPAAGFFGSDSFTYTAHDGKGGTGIATVSITVEPDNRPPTVELAGPAIVDEGAAPATYTATAADPDGDSLDYSWTGATGSGATATFAADDGPASTTITVTVDDGTETATASLRVTVRNVAPTVDGGPPVAGVWGLPIVFAGSATDPSSADTAAGFAGGWTFGDGASATGLTATHAYADPGPFLAVLTARDKDGGSGSDSTPVAVGKRPTSVAYTGSRSDAPPAACGDRATDPNRLTFGARGAAGREGGACTGSATTQPYGSVTLSARLSDLADATTARLAGRTLRFQVGTLSITATTNAAGEATAKPALPIPPGSYEVVVTFAGDTHYLPSSTRAPLEIASTPGKVTGGGLRSLNHQGRGGFNVQGPTKGELQWQNGTLNFHAPEITALGVASDGRSAWFAGKGKDGRPFAAYVEDNGEPGRDDVFKLWVGGVLQTPGDGKLAGGNIQIHKG